MAKKKRAPLSPLTVIGELLLIGGLGVLGYMVWQPWYAAIGVGGNQADMSAERSAEWRTNVSDASNEALPIAKLGDEGDIFGVLYIPAMGKNYSYQVAEGVGRPEPLDNWDSGIGHYPSTAKPGEVGNVALAAHRNGVIAPFRDVEFLRVGDPIYLETKDGWYTYNFRTQEVVTPDSVDVLNPFPYEKSNVTDDSMLTLTSCFPKNGAALRVISFAVFDEFTPRADGPPAELAEVNSNVSQEA